MTTYTLQSKQILRDDITFIDQQLELARNKMREGNRDEAWFGDRMPIMSFLI